MNGTADHTSGGLRKGDLMFNKFGKIVSKKMSRSATKAYKNNDGGIKSILKKGRAPKFSKRNQPRK